MRRNVRVLAAGPGGLPSRIAGDAQVIAPLTLASGESRTVWLVFDTVAPFPQNPRMTLLVPASGPAPPEIKVTLRAPSEPTWIPAPARAVGWGIHSRLEGRVYGADGYEFGLDAGLWIARRPFRADLCLRLGDLFPATADGLAHGSAVGFTGSGTWYPFGLPGGIYGEAGLSRVHFPDTAAPFEDHWSPFAGGGIELGTQPGATSATYLRLGYVHSFRSPTPLTDGFLVAWGGSFEL